VSKQTILSEYSTVRCQWSYNFLVIRISLVMRIMSFKKIKNRELKTLLLVAGLPGHNVGTNCPAVMITCEAGRHVLSLDIFSGSGS